MPIPAAEKMRRYREKLKANLEKHESYLRKDKRKKEKKDSPNGCQREERVQKEAH